MKKLFFALVLTVAVNSAFSQTKVNKNSSDSLTRQSIAPRQPMIAQFDQIFKTNVDGSISPRYVVQVGGVTMSPGVAFGQGVSMGGVDIAAYKGHDLLVDTAKGVVILKGIKQ